jgi:hypothetical protein
MSTPHWSLLAFLLLLGAALRVAYLDVPPIEFHPTRQYRSALIARAQSTAALEALTPIERGNAAAMGQAQAQIEPEIIEPVAAWLYDLTGREDLRLPRALSILGWLLAASCAGWLLVLGGVPMMWAGLATGLTLFLPYTIEASRAFMPDPWMTGLTMAALALGLRDHKAPSMGGLIARLLVAAAAIYLKPMAGFYIAPAWLALDVSRYGVMRGVLRSGLLLAVAAAPAGWHYYSIITSGSAITDRRFFPELWPQARFWAGWLDMTVRVLGWGGLLAALMGLALKRGALPRLLIGACVGHVAVGLTFSHHMHTHDYYSLPLIPIAAAAGALAAELIARRLGLARVATAILTGIAIVALAYPSNPLRVYGDIDRARQSAADYTRIGEVTSHSPLVLSLDGAYGYPLAYHAGVTTSQLPLSIDRAIDATVAGSLRSTVLNRSARYFVGTLQPELDADPWLRAWLDQRRLLVDLGGSPVQWRYVVYDLSASAGLDDGPTAPGTSSTDAPPIGFVDAPPPQVPITVGADPVIVQGWALDDVGLAGVEVMLTTASGDRTLGRVTREGNRPDVAAAFPAMPDLDRALWRFFVWPDDRAVAPATLTFVARDLRGQRTVLGTRELR